MKILTVIGTRPDAIKMAPVLRSLQTRPEVESIVCSTGQHRELLDLALQGFDLRVDFDLSIMRPRQSLNSIMRRVIGGMDAVLRKARPDRVLVHGDTSTALAAALAAFNYGVPVAHVEAGLRSLDLHSPWPEEMNRRTLDGLCDLLFAPTNSAKQNLEAERVPGRIVVTGNTGIDALGMTMARLNADAALRNALDGALPRCLGGRPLLLVTGHRRENLGDALLGVCLGLQQLSARNEVEIVYVMHPNPAVCDPVRRMLGDRPNVHLLPPQDYLTFVRLLQRAQVVLTDSGGIQEEAPALGKPVLVTRNETERPEGVAMGAARLVGTDPDRIQAEVERLISVTAARPARHAELQSPYGDGRASERIVQALLGLPVEEFRPRYDPLLVTPSPQPPAASWPLSQPAAKWRRSP